MTYIKITIFICFFATTLSSTWAREKTPDYVVYQAIGNCTKNAGKKISKLKKGDFLSSPDVVNLSTGATLILVCANYKSFQLNLKGKYAVKDLKRYCTKSNGSFTANYFRFVWDELTHPHSSPEAEPEKYMKTAGAVTRGKLMYNLRINVDTLNCFDEDFGVKFTINKNPITVKFFAANNAFKILSVQKFTTFISFNDFIKTGPPAGVYYWYIDKLPYKKSNLYVLNLLDGKQYRIQVDKVLSNVIGTDKAERAFMAAYLLEQQHFLGEAEKYYKLAAQLNPEKKVYQMISARFSENGTTL